MPSSVDVHVVIDRGVTVIRVAGDVDIDNQRTIAEIVAPLARSAERLVLDLTEVGFIDSTGIGVLTGLRLELAGRGLSLRVVPSRRVRSALTLAGLTSVLQVHDSVQAARHAADEPPA